MKSEAPATQLSRPNRLRTLEVGAQTVRRMRRALLIVAVSALSSACGGSICDAQPAPTCCARALYKAPSDPTALRYRTLDKVTVTCPPLNPKRCERLLRDRACELGAEILVTHTWTVVGRRGPAQVTKEALLVRFEPELR